MARLTNKYLTNLFRIDPVNAGLVKKGYKPSTDHILAFLTKQHKLTHKRQQQIHSLGCKVYDLDSAE